MYPLGHAPYLRAPLVPVDPDGVKLQGEGDEPSYQATVFEAGLDASSGKSWPRQDVGPSQQW